MSGIFDSDEAEELERKQQEALLRQVSSKSNRKVVTQEEMDRKKKELEERAAKRRAERAAKGAGAAKPEPTNADLTAKLIAEEKARRAAAADPEAAKQKAAEEEARKAEEEAKKREAEEKRQADINARKQREADLAAERERKAAEEKARIAAERAEEERRAAEAVKAESGKEDPAAVIAESQFAGFGKEEDEEAYAREAARMAAHTGVPLDAQPAPGNADGSADQAQAPNAQAQAEQEERQREVEAREEARMAKMLANAQPAQATAVEAQQAQPQPQQASADPAEEAERREEARMAKLFGAPAPAQPAPTAEEAPKVQAQRQEAVLSESPGGGWEIAAGTLEGYPEKNALTLLLRGTELSLVYSVPGADGKKLVREYRWDLPRPFAPEHIRAVYDGKFTIYLSTGTATAAGAKEGEITTFPIAAHGNEEEVNVDIKSIPEGYELSCTPSKYDEEVTLALESPAGEKQICEFKFVHVVEEETEDSIVRRRITVKQNIRVPFEVTTGSFISSPGEHGQIVKVLRPTTAPAPSSGSATDGVHIPIQ